MAVKQNHVDQKKSVRWVHSLIIIPLLITNIATVFILNNRNEQKSFKNPYPLVDPARELVSQENYLVNIQPLREELNKLVDENGKDSISLYYEQLNSGANITINKDLRLW